MTECFAVGFVFLNRIEQEGIRERKRADSVLVGKILNQLILSRKDVYIFGCGCDRRAVARSFIGKVLPTHVESCVQESLIADGIPGDILEVEFRHPFSDVVQGIHPPSILVINYYLNNPTVFYRVVYQSPLEADVRRGQIRERAHDYLTPFTKKRPGHILFDITIVVAVGYLLRGSRSLRCWRRLYARMPRTLGKS